jgi:hypothetical protein
VNAREHKDNSIITDAESVGSEIGVGQLLGMLQGIFFLPKECPADAILDLGIKPFNIPNCPSGINQPVRHRPNTSLCVLTLPAL